jgi:hypothetical protein
MCVHVNLVKKSNVLGEEEYLLAPCKSPVVLCSLRDLMTTVPVSADCLLDDVDRLGVHSDQLEVGSRYERRPARH